MYVFLKADSRGQMTSVAADCCFTARGLETDSGKIGNLTFYPQTEAETDFQRYEVHHVKKTIGEIQNQLAPQGKGLICNTIGQIRAKNRFVQ